MDTIKGIGVKQNNDSKRMLVTLTNYCAKIER